MANMSQVRVVAVCSLSGRKGMNSRTSSRTVSAPATLHDVREYGYHLEESEERYILHRRSGPRELCVA